MQYVQKLPEYHKQALYQRKQTNYQAWQIVNSAIGNKASAGRIDALEDLVKDGVSLENLNVEGAALRFINLENATIPYSKFNNATLTAANLKNTFLREANFSGAKINGVDFSYADLCHANFTKAETGLVHRDNEPPKQSNFQETWLMYANFDRANLNKANFKDADVKGADFTKALNITPEQIKSAKNWNLAKYNPKLREQLGLPAESIAQKLNETCPSVPKDMNKHRWWLIKMIKN